jgi:multidrug efflux pump subunit AcrA (membrane-fusion protein)
MNIDKIKNPDALHYQKFTDSDDDRPLNDLRIIARRKLAYWGIALAVVCVLAFCLLKIPIEQNFQCTLKGKRQEKIFRFAKIVHVNEVFVKAGKKVRKNAPLVSITSPEIVQFISEYQTAQRNLNLFYAHDTLIFHSEKTSLALQIEELNLSIQQLLAEKAHKDTIFRTEKAHLHFKETEAARRFEVNQQLYKEKAIAEFELKDSETAKITASTQLKQLIENYKKEVQHYQTALRKLSINRNLQVQQLNKLELEKGKKEADLLHATQIAQEKLSLGFGDFEIKGQNILLKAENDGEVTYIFDGSKEVPTNQILIKIMEAKYPLYAYAEIPPDKVGFIKERQEATLKVSTFPYYRWGVVQGKVHHLSKTPATNNHYPFEVALLELGRLQGKLQIGMTGELIIMTEERTMLELVFEKLYETKEKVLGF